MGKENKYRVIVQGNTAIIYNNRTGFNRCWDVRNFVFGQGLYDDRTDKYPNYIHTDMWQQYDNNRRL